MGKCERESEREREGGVGRSMIPTLVLSVSRVVAVFLIFGLAQHVRASSSLGKFSFFCFLSLLFQARTHTRITRRGE